MMQLPWELEEDILFLIPAKSIARLRCVCKRWNTLANNMRFVNKHLARARPQFILLSGSNICSVDVNLDGPSIEVHNLPSDIPGYEDSMPVTIEYCEGLLIYFTCYGTGICNPWLRQTRWIKSKLHVNTFNGMGYDNSRLDKHYKILESDYYDNTTVEASITEFGYDAWKSYEFESDNWSLYCPQKSVSLNGTLYWVANKRESYEHFLQSFDFSTERFTPYCILPSKHRNGVRSLAVFRGDRFSFLEQNYDTRNIEVWVTKKKIKNGDGKNVEWMKLMNVSVPEWSSLKVSYYRPSYFIDEPSLSLVLCCLNNEGKAYIYIAKGDKFDEIKINDRVEYHPRHRTYFPSLIQVPTFTMSGKGKTQQVGSRFALPRGVEASDGVGGKEWDDGFFNAVKKISVGYSNFNGVVFVRFDYCNGHAVVVGAAHGNATHIPYTILIADDDYIKAVEGTYTESRITSIVFRMHKRNKVHRYGLFNGRSFVLGGGGDSKIIGFYGKSSHDNLTALGVHLSV